MLSTSMKIALALSKRTAIYNKLAIAGVRWKKILQLSKDVANKSVFNQGERLIEEDNQLDERVGDANVKD